MYKFNESKTYVDSSRTYEYKNMISIMGLEYMFEFLQHFRLRAGLKYIDQETAARGFKHYDYKRAEWMPAVFFEYLYSKQASVELAVMESFYDWRYEASALVDNYTERSNIEKVKLGWNYRFDENSVLQISLSHVFSIMGFGGGNIQFMTFF